MLAGATGFVGGNIARQKSFDCYSNSTNFKAAAGQHFDLLVFSAAPALKWWANAHPADDYSIICDLIGTLSQVSVDRFVLISTIDVYPNVQGVDETSAIDADANAPYGRHRYLLECAVRERFPKHHIVRLPGLFGPGLKKNILYDLICKNMVDKINPMSRFQWYPLSRIWSDLSNVIAKDLRVVNFGVEPIATSQILERFFPAMLESCCGSSPVNYDMRTIFSDRLNARPGNYLLRADEILEELGNWLLDPEVTCA